MMSKVLITKQQYEDIEKLLDVGLNKGVTEGQAKSTILETHIKKGWDGTEIESLKLLSTDELATVLFSDNYEIKKNKLKYQEYLVTYILDEYNRFQNKVARRNVPELSKSEVINLSLENIESYKEKLDIDDETEIDFEVIKIEEENAEQSEQDEDEDEDDEM